jgi:UDP-N-acetylmuramoyl-tripeptide--D-alanyl-D-alanine ligase
VGAVCETPSSEFISFQWATRYTAVTIKNSEVVNTNLVGIYNYYNLLCAACVGNYFKVEDALINKALREYQPSNNRSQLHKTANNTLILDYYNANPSSMNLALQNFAAMDKKEKMVILGDMLELGNESAQEHDAIISLLSEKGLSNCILVGPLFHAAGKKAGIPVFQNSDEAAVYLKEHPVKGQTVLIKGSRGIKLEKVVEVL